jgi:hypothetical protein
VSAAATAAKERLIRAALRVLAAEHQPDEYPWADAEAEHADEVLALAARDLARATDNLPEGERPIGWDAPKPVVTSDCCVGTGFADYAAVPCPNPKCPVPPMSGATTS